MHAYVLNDVSADLMCSCCFALAWLHQVIFTYVLYRMAWYSCMWRVLVNVGYWLVAMWLKVIDLYVIDWLWCTWLIANSSKMTLCSETILVYFHFEIWLFCNFFAKIPIPMYTNFFNDIKFKINIFILLFNKLFCINLKYWSVIYAPGSGCVCMLIITFTLHT